MKRIRTALLGLLPLVLSWLAARLRERSTIAGAVGVLTAVGVNIEPEQVEAISTIGAGLSALFMALPDRPGDGAALAEIDAAIQAVKAAYPKPDAEES